MLKLVGAACVMIATIGYSGYLLGNQKLHKNVLQSLISMAELLSGYIGYERLTMQEAFARLSGKRYFANFGTANGDAAGTANGDATGTANGDAAGTANGDVPGTAQGESDGAMYGRADGVLNWTLARIADRLAAGTDESLEVIWREVFTAEAPRLFLREEELSIVLEMGKSLGGADIETQLRCLQGGAHRLEERLADAARELAEKRRLYGYLGVAVGAMAVLVLI